jgi:hypothetical protein
MKYCSLFEIVTADQWWIWIWSEKFEFGVRNLNLEWEIWIWSDEFEFGVMNLEWWIWSAEFEFGVMNLNLEWWIWIWSDEFEFGVMNLNLEWWIWIWSKEFEFDIWFINDVALVGHRMNLLISPETLLLFFSHKGNKSNKSLPKFAGFDGLMFACFLYASYSWSVKLYNTYTISKWIIQ